LILKLKRKKDIEKTNNIFQIEFFGELKKGKVRTDLIVTFT